MQLDDAGYYSLQVQVGVCKSDVITKRVDVANLANFAVSPTPINAKICQGSQITLTVNNVANHTYSWLRNGTPTGQSTTSINVNDEASYSVVVTNNTLSCDATTDPVATIVYTTPVAGHTVQGAACTGVDVPFTNQSTGDSRGTLAYTWNFGDATSSTSTSPTKQYTNAGTFQTTVTASYSDASGTGCSATSTQKAVVVSATVVPTVNSTVSILCPDGTATLSVAGTFNSITWSNSATGSSTTVTGPGTYTANTVDVNNCASSDNIVIDAHPVPTVTATADPAIIKVGETSQFTATGASTYAWTPIESLSDPAIANPVAAPIETTTYTVLGTNDEGCTGSFELVLEVDPLDKFPVWFSPNGDGTYDVWNIGATTPDKADCTLSIFDGKGMRIFEGKGQNWDGKYKNNDAPAGTY